MSILTEAGLMSACASAELNYYYKSGTAPQFAGPTWYTSWYAAGSPLAATASAAGLSGATLGRTKVGSMPIYAANAGNRKYLLGWAGVCGNQGGIGMLVDRLWENSGLVVTTTTAQTINSVTLPARDGEGTTNGEDVFAAIEVSTATTNASAITNMTISYTNSDGTAGRTGTIPVNHPSGGFPASAKIGTIVPFALQAGDRGVRSIQSCTLGTSLVTGVVSLVMFRIITLLPFTSPEYPMDALEVGMPSDLSNSCLQLIHIPISATAGTHHGLFRFGEG